MKSGNWILLLLAGYVIWSLVDADKKGIAGISPYNAFHFFPSAATWLGLK